MPAAPLRRIVMDTVPEIVVVRPIGSTSRGFPSPSRSSSPGACITSMRRRQAEAEARQATAEVSAGRVAPAAFKAAQAAATPCWQLRNCSEASRATATPARNPASPAGWPACVRTAASPVPLWLCPLPLRPRPGYGARMTQYSPLLAIAAAATILFFCVGLTL